MTDDEQERFLFGSVLAEMGEATVREFAARIKKPDQTARRKVDELVEEGRATAAKEKRGRTTVKVYRPAARDAV